MSLQMRVITTAISYFLRTRLSWVLDILKKIAVWSMQDSRNLIILILLFGGIFLHIKNGRTAIEYDNFVEKSLVEAKLVRNNLIERMRGRTVIPIPKPLDGKVKQSIKIVPVQGDPFFVYMTKDDQVIVSSSGTIKEAFFEQPGLKTAGWEFGMRFGMLFEHESPRPALYTHFYRYRSLYFGTALNPKFIGIDISYRLPFKLFSNTYVGVGNGINFEDGYSLFSGVSVKF